MCKVWMANIISICKKVFCCNPQKHTYHYVRYEEDTVVHNNVLYDMKNINFGVDNNVDRQWRTCDVYEG